MASQTDLGPTPFIYMDTTTKTMLTLLRASLTSQEPSLPRIDTDEWERLFWLARKHGVVTMVNDAIELLPPELQPQGDIALSWTLSAERTRYHFNHQQQVLQLIDQLPEVQRTVIQLRDIEGMRYDEIAQATGLSETQVKVYLHRARKRIRETL